VPNELTPESIAEAATQPAEGSVDGRSAKAVPIPDQIEAAKFAAGAASVEGTNAGGGSRSGWGALRGAVGRPGAAHQ
jgi:hypothetical protein